MDKRHIGEMSRGWFIGAFDPSLLQTDEFEVAVKYYVAGEAEALHHHRLATEFTVVVFGSVRMNGQVHRKGDIIRIDKFEATDFVALEDSATVVVKYPGSINDKYLGEFND